MSGAFNIDIEIGPGGDDKSKVKIFCASLTNNWSLLRSFDELKSFYSSLSGDDSVKAGKISIGSLPGSNDTTSYENLLSELACNAGVLRLKLFQDFLKMPVSVREGLSYAKHKPFGKKLKESYLLRHPRYVRSSAKKKYIRLTQDERGCSLITYVSENNTKKAQSALKLSKQTEMKTLKEVQYGFVIKAGKRQWVLQAGNSNEFKSWFDQLTNVLTKLGGKVDKSGYNTQNNNNNNNNDDKKNVDVIQSNDIKTLQEENKKLKQEIENWKRKYNDSQNKVGINEEIKMDDGDEYDDDVIGGDAGVIRKQLIKEFTKEKDDLIRDFEIQKDDLRAEIEDLRKQLETKVAVENGRTGLKGLFGTGYKEEELKSEIDAEKNQLDSLTDEEKSKIKFVHRHWHRHAHKHIHHHRHVHIHDNTKKPPQSFTNTHTVSHTITHTNTQFQIKKASFF